MKSKNYLVEEEKEKKELEEKNKKEENINLKMVIEDLTKKIKELEVSLKEKDIKNINSNNFK